MFLDIVRPSGLTMSQNTSSSLQKVKEKWGDAVYDAGTGAIFAIPTDAAHVLRIEPR